MMRYNLSYLIKEWGEEILIELTMTVFSFLSLFGREVGDGKGEGVGVTVKVASHKGGLPSHFYSSGVR